MGLTPPAVDRQSVAVIRAQDLLALSFEFINLEVKTKRGRGAILKRINAGDPAFIILHFPPQNIAEQAFFETAAQQNKDGTVSGFPLPEPGKISPDPDAEQAIEADGKEENDQLQTPPVATRIAEPSRLVFRVPDSEIEIPYRLEALLERCLNYELNLAPAGRPPFEFNLLPSQGSKPTQSESLGGILNQPGLASRFGRFQQAARLAVLNRRAGRPAQGGGAGALSQQSALKKMQDLLDMAEKSLPFPRPPHPDETAIEAPYRLIISPHLLSAWRHLTRPAHSRLTDRVELWHTRLSTVAADENGNEDLSLHTVRAIWTRDAGFKSALFDPITEQPVSPPDHSNTDPFRTSLDFTDRHNLVHLSTRFLLTPIKTAAGEVDVMALVASPTIRARRLMLSSLGAWLDLYGTWDPPVPQLTVESWLHRATMGRDHYVRVIYKGYLFPFGHRASLIKITERKFHPNEPGNPAYLRQRMYIVVREPEKAYSRPGGRNKENHLYDRQFPFTKIRLTTLVTPDLDPPENSDFGKKLQSLFWPQVGGADFHFHAVAEGFDGREIEFTIPLLFADTSIASVDTQTVLIDLLAGAYRTGQGADERARRERPINGQQVMYIDPVNPDDPMLVEPTDNTFYATDTLVFDVEVNSKFITETEPNFYPKLKEAHVRIPSLNHLSGNQKPVRLTYHPVFLKKGQNPLEVFADVADMDGNPLDLDFNSQGDRSGGLVKPSFRVSALSRQRGAVTAADSLMSDTGFDPASFFAGLDAKLFGTIPIVDLITAGALDQVPRVATERLTVLESFLADLGQIESLLPPSASLQSGLAAIQVALEPLLIDPFAPPSDTLATALTDFREQLIAFLGALTTITDLDTTDKRKLKVLCDNLVQDLANPADGFLAQLLAENTTVRMEWSPAIRAWSLGGAQSSGSNLFEPGSLSVAVTMRVSKQLQGPPTTTIACTLKDFDLNLIAPHSTFLRLRFERVEFFSSGGEKADVNVILNDVEFLGVLEFVETLRSLIDLAGFSDPPALAITSKGIDASYSLSLPSLAIGVFSIQNISLGAGFTIPFVDEPLSVRFNFCERHQPFQITVTLFGGGGFFALSLDPSGIQVLEAAFEFGAALSIDLGVASGGVEIMAGIYFRMEADDATLAGYFRLGGHLDVMGIVSMSIELYLELRYEFSTGKMFGRATITVEIDVLVFSGSVEITCERQFAGSNGDPTFAQVMAPDESQDYFPWRDYCQAFID